jgi:uncharacterized membrane protein YGL010W
MKSLNEQLAQYEEQHKTTANRFTHFVGVPAILIGLLILLSWVSISLFSRWHFTFAWFGCFALIIYYFFLDIKLASVMAVVLILLTALCSWIAYPAPTQFNFVLFLILLVGGIALQFMGHKIENSTTAFLKRLSKMLIAPMFVLIEIIKLLKLEKHFGLEKTIASKESDA